MTPTEELIEKIIYQKAAFMMRYNEDPAAIFINRSAAALILRTLIQDEEGPSFIGDDRLRMLEGIPVKTSPDLEQNEFYFATRNRSINECNEIQT